jgi:hypothetical protein
VPCQTVPSNLGWTVKEETEKMKERKKIKMIKIVQLL